jgi:hypothetical protein
MHASLTIGPAIAGLITAAAGLKTCYLIDAISFGFALYAVARLPSMRPQAQDSRPGLSAIGEVLRFVVRTRIRRASSRRRMTRIRPSPRTTTAVTLTECKGVTGPASSRRRAGRLVRRAAALIGQRGQGLVHVAVGGVDVAGQAGQARPDAGPQAGPGQPGLGSGHVDRDDRAVTRGQAQALAQPVGQPHVVVVNGLDPDALDDLQGGPGADPGEPRGRGVEPAAAAGQAQRRAADTMSS